MTLRHRLTAQWMCYAALAFYSLAAGAQSNMNQSMTEVLQLPQFCWYQMSQKKKQFDAPQYKIRGKCGGSNHYCAGLLHFQRSQKPGLSRWKKTTELKQALSATNYTLRHMEKTSDKGRTCSIYQHAHQTKLKLEAMLRFVGD